MFFTVYKILNLINGKIYVGTHITNRLYDGYMGSGTIIKRAINKHGVEAFYKDILYIFDNAQDMYDREAEIVNEAFVADPNTYNIKLGGQGGWDYVNNNKLGFNLSKWTGDKNKRHEKATATQLSRGLGVFSKESRSRAAQRITLINKSRIGAKHTAVSKSKMQQSHIGKHDGSKNSQFGTCWVTKDRENLKIKKDDLDKYLQLGYKRGRVMRTSLKCQDR
jgi:group I intron endonuclease